MDVARKHQTKIARDTMKLSCLGAQCRGGMDHVEARRFFLTIGKLVEVPDDCQCWRRHVGEVRHG